MNSICYADSDTFFISYISKLLVLPRNELTHTTMFDTFRETIHNRYHQVVSHETLRPPPSINLCIKCFKLVERKVDEQVHCCMCYIHKDCVADELQCPYCGECWLLMSCCFCYKPITLPYKYYFREFNKHKYEMLCCGAQDHLMRCSLLSQIKSCPVCCTPHHTSFPVSATNVYTFLFRHNVQRRHNYLWRTWRLKYYSYNYLYSLCNQPHNLNFVIVIYYTTLTAPTVASCWSLILSPETSA